MGRTPKSLSKLFSWIKPTHAKGSWIYSNEKPYKFLDFTSGIGALSTGHSHPYIVKMVQKQSEMLVHAPQQVFGNHLSLDKFINKLDDFMPKNLNNYFLVSSGSEATDNSIKIAKRYTNRNNILCVRSGFHGRTLGALSITSSNIFCKSKVGGLLSNVYFCDPNIDSFNDIFNKFVGADEVAAFIFEPVQGEGGINLLSEKFIKEATQFCNDNGILVISDEVQSGSGRTGSMWNITQKNVTPDIMTFGKGIASGYPLAGVASTDIIMDSLSKGFLGGTYGGNAIVCEAASATLDIFSRENIFSNVNQKSAYINYKLNCIPGIKAIRCYGLMIAIELFNTDKIDTIIYNLSKKGVCILKCGSKGQFLRLLPPLNVTFDEIDFFIENFSIILNENL